jgi:hypothetical protein
MARLGLTHIEDLGPEQETSLEYPNVMSYEIDKIPSEKLNFILPPKYRLCKITLGKKHTLN